MISGFYHSLSLRLGNLTSSTSGTEATTRSNWQSEPSVSTPATSKLRYPTLRTAGFSSFIGLVAHLEDFLDRGDKSKFLNGKGLEFTTRSPAGAGGFFTVDRARLEDPSRANGKRYVAVKTPKDQVDDPTRWHDILLEVRALLHEPLRYHPNIVRLLDIGWSASAETGSPFPTFVLEYADFGTLDSLQRSQNLPLPFRIKQKLCYDVGRGLSILHACGIVHGDLKHENVLIFANRHNYPPDQPYTAKLADFGGAIMDVGTREGHLLRMATIPYEAPELGCQLTKDGIKATDTYSFGMLIWRAMIDCQDVLVAARFQDQPGPLKIDEMDRLRALKSSENPEGLQSLAIASIDEYSRAHHWPRDSLAMIKYVIRYTLRADPAARSLVKAQARLRGIQVSKVESYLLALEKEEERRTESDRSLAPGLHGIDMDSIGYAMGRMGDDFDIQRNLPGSRRDLPEPFRGGFLFDAAALKGLLSWQQQVTMLEELEMLSESPHHDEDSAEIQPWVAAYHLFQAHLIGFGTLINPQRACYWLWKTSLAVFDTADQDYLAKAWLTRLCHAVGTACPLTPEEQLEDLFMSIIRGHIDCVEDSQLCLSRFTDTKKHREANERIVYSMFLHQGSTGGTGMPHYISRNMPREYSLTSPVELDAQIKQELGREYQHCLRSASESPVTPPPKDRYRFDKIYVNQRGHGLLHYAAAMGVDRGLRHMILKYRCDINLPNQSLAETPLVCACRSGQFRCAMALLDHGASPNASEHGEEGPLHWISRFRHESAMRTITQRLVDAGADLSKSCGGMRKDVRRIFADWEDRLRLPLKPLGRAVLMKSLLAVKCLLEIASADPTERNVLPNKETTVVDMNAIELAAVLTLPDILQELLDHQDAKDGGLCRAFDEWDMLDWAHRLPDKGALDPLTLQSRLVRCGDKYKEWFTETVRILHHRRIRQSDDTGSSTEFGIQAAKGLCKEVELGQVDIVQSLISIGNEVNGVPNHRPVAAAVRSNNMEMFELLLSNGAELTWPASVEEQTLLQIFASRPNNTPEDLKIAEFLVENGVEVEATCGDHPSPLASAIKNGYFALADLLIAHGAGRSVNDFCQWEPAGPRLSVLGALLQSHTYASLQGITYLTVAHQTGVLKLGALADASKSLSAVHVLALQEPGLMNPRQQVSSRIIHKILSVFPDPASLGDSLINEDCGNPATAAIWACNEQVVSALLETEYQQCFTGTVKVGPLYGATELMQGIFPAWQLLNRFSSLLPQYGREQFYRSEVAEKIQSLDRMRRTLYSALPHIYQAYPQPTGESAYDDAQILDAAEQCFELLWNKWRELEAVPGTLARDGVVPENNTPICLAQMTDKKPENWWDKKEKEPSSKLLEIV